MDSLGRRHSEQQDTQLMVNECLYTGGLVRQYYNWLMFRVRFQSRFYSGMTSNQRKTGKANVGLDEVEI